MCEYKKANYIPIPLTPEILEKAGISQNITKTAWWDTDENILIADMRGKFYLAEWAGSSEEPELDTKIEILYLHQLQNLYFALTGKELTINFTTVFKNVTIEYIPRNENH